MYISRYNEMKEGVKMDFELWSQKNKLWKEEVDELRNVLLSTNTIEEIKWGKPCYSVSGKNVAIIQPFKNFLALMFFQGVLLKDESKLLIAVGENSQSAMQIRFTNKADIVKNKTIIQQYILESTELAISGAVVPKKDEISIPYPDELIDLFKEDLELETAFENLTRGRRRAYLIYFTQAKQPITRLKRITQYIEKIKQGKGLND